MIRELTYRQLYVLVAVLLTFTACSNEGDALFDGERPMTFSVAAEQQTRATRAAYTGSRFGVYATNYTGDYKNTTGILHMPNARINYAGGTCTPDKTYYWPDGNMHFAAYSPYVTDLSTSDLKITLPEKPYAGYAFQGKVEGRTNWMFADEMLGSLDQDFTTGSVPITFRHALTQVKFQARLSDATPLNISLKINSLYIRNIRVNGSATFTHNGKSDYSAVVPADDANKWNTEGMKWTTQEFPLGSSHNALYLDDYEVNCSTMSGISTTFKEFKDCFYLMPQQLYTTGESQFLQQLEVNYTIVTDGVDGLPKSVSVPIKTSDIQAWTVNKSVLYSLVVETGESLTLTAAVQPWKLEEFTNEFDETVTVNADGKIVWTPGTCTVIDENVVLNNDISQPAEFTFTIAGPLGGTWQAIFVTQEGNPTAFTLSQSEGEVGKPCTVQVSANQINNTSTANVAELRFVVRCAGAILPVDELTTLPDGHNYKIVQNIKLN